MFRLIFGFTVLLASATLAQTQAERYQLTQLNRAGTAAYQTGDYAQALRQFEDAYALTQNEWPDNDPEVLVISNNLAVLYNAMGRYLEAEPLLTRGLEVRESIWGPDDPETLIGVYNLAHLYSAMGRYSDAESLYTRALEARERVLGTEHPDTLTTMNNLAMLYNATGRHLEAEQLYSRVLEIRENLLGSEDFSTLGSLNNLAELYRETGRLSNALELHSSALEARERMLGPEHPDTLMTLNNVALLYEDMGRFVDAEPLYSRVLEASERVLGPEHPATLTTMNNLAMLYVATGRFAEAEPLLTFVLEARGRLFEQGHPEVLMSLNNLAGYYYATQRYADAEFLYDNAVETSVRSLGAEDPRTLVIFNNLGLLYSAMGRHVEAEALNQQILNTRMPLLGAEHPHTFISQFNLAAAHRSVGRYREAESLLTSALAASERVLGPGHLLTVLGVNNLAFLYNDMGLLTEAEPLYTRALEVRERVLGPEHPDTLTSVTNLALLRLAVDEVAVVAASVGDLDRALGSWTRRVGQELRAGASDALRGNLTSDSTLRDVAIGAALAHPEHADLGARALLMTKGVAGATDAALSRLVAMDTRPEVRAAADALRSAEGMLFAAFQSEDPERIQAARSDRDAARSSLFALIDPPLAFQPDAITPDAVLATLSPREVFLDYGIFRPVDFQTGRVGEPHILLAAYRGGQGMTLFDIGPVAAVQEAILLTTDASPRFQEISMAARAAWQARVLSQHPHLSENLFAPVASWLQDAQSLTISPDGILARVNFAALPDPDRPLRPLSARIPVRIVPSGRSLLQSAQDLPQPPVSTTFLGVGLTDFGPYDEARCNRTHLTQPEGGYCPLPNAVREVTQIGDLFGPAPAATLLLEAEATEATVTAAMPGTRFIHLATHGGEQLAGVRTEGLNNVGLALHGISRDPASERTVTAANDGILTGAEVARLMLAGTDLVVMSACDTALGDDAAAEGIWSMAHGFRLAGANAVMMSLWKVSDDTAPQFMAQFYQTVLERQQTRPDEPVQTALRTALRDTQAWAFGQGWSYWDYAPFVLVEN